MSMTRRKFLAASGMAMASGPSLLAGLAEQGQTQTKAAGGVWQLVAQWKETELAGTKVRLRCYNGQVPGPLKVIQPGELLRIHVKNSLTHYDSTGWDGNPDVPHDLNTTNLHLHGLDIVPHLFQPVGTSNPMAPMIHIHPGGSYDYEIPIAKDQPPGLNWYHPHHHGSTAVQAVSGMAGGLESQV